MERNYTYSQLQKKGGNKEPKEYFSYCCSFGDGLGDDARGASVEAALRASAVGQVTQENGTTFHLRNKGYLQTLQEGPPCIFGNQNESFPP